MQNREFIYKKRIIDDVIDFYSNISGAIYLRGPKWVGKTTTAKQHSKTVYELGVKPFRDAFISKYNFDYLEVFKSPKPILFDEWQEFPQIWDDIRGDIDRNFGSPNQYFLTGSKEISPETRKEFIHHSGIGRIHDLIMRPMSLYESGESNGSISLLSLFDPSFKITGIKSELSNKDLIFATCRGGWPSSLSLKKEYALNVVETIVSSTVNGKTFLEENESNQYTDPEIMNKILRIYSRNVSTLTKNQTMLNDLNSDDFNLSRTTFNKYKNILIDSYLIEEASSWSSSIRSKTNVISTPKKLFVDHSIGIQALNLSPQKLEERPIDYGIFFENLCIRDLRIYSSKQNGKVYYYKDRYGLEADAVLTLKDGRYALIEIKLGFNSALNACEQLLKLKNKIIEHNKNVKDKSHLMDLPSALIVLHSGQDALTYKENIHIVPIGCLKD
ncbi:conserved hypothetical [Malacoplasma penetrans HF-2]|uniref:Conserved hypothetical n=1 Tax=Malacoplasma penetrans (strain HF-2) TaxID=272633 RepID=Q8EV36_MALP2|nr:DUF4143 domain-containing protein [Malacoplasma penetrans]BAC44525.1 conserved hypothetical [Malacoplasma penetrans HF-2]